MKFKRSSIVVACLMATVAGSAMASSHREAPFITTSPKVDGTDFYMFTSYESGRADYVTLIANYQPLQAPYGGPNYFSMDPNALYEIHIDNNGDAKEDITFQFRFKNNIENIALPTGGSANVAIPLIQGGQVSGLSGTNLNLKETYSVNVVRGDRRKGTSQAITKDGGGATFQKPVDYIGEKTFGGTDKYKEYADAHIFPLNIPGCNAKGKVFVGQRQEGFAVNLGAIFDLVNAPLSFLLDPSNKDFGNKNGPHILQQSNVTSIALEVPKTCLTNGDDPVIGGWTTASLRQARLLNGKPSSGHQTSEKAGGAWVQVSRLGNPLVNEVVIGLKDKDKFNASKPANDLQFGNYVLYPTLPALLGIALAGGDATAAAPTNLPRTDLATVFLTGIDTINKPKKATPSEMLRLNTSTPPTPFASQNRLGAAVGDTAGFPNGRRPKDDVVDIALVAMVGGLCQLNGPSNVLKLNEFPELSLSSACEPNSVPLKDQSLTIHDAVDQELVDFLPGFPYLNTPNPGAKLPAAPI